MSDDVIRIMGQIAGIGGLALGVLLLIFREIIRKNVFPDRLTKEQGYNLLRLMIILVWTVALVGIAAWVYVTVHPSSRHINGSSTTNGNGSDDTPPGETPQFVVEPFGENPWREPVRLTGAPSSTDIAVVDAVLKGASLEQARLGFPLLSVSFRNRSDRKIALKGLAIRIEERVPMTYPGFTGVIEPSAVWIVQLPPDGKRNDSGFVELSPPRLIDIAEGDAMSLDVLFTEHPTRWDTENDPEDMPGIRIRDLTASYVADLIFVFEDDIQVSFKSLKL
jgi:hypothetical protein